MCQRSHAVLLIHKPQVRVADKCPLNPRLVTFIVPPMPAPEVQARAAVYSSRRPACCTVAPSQVDDMEVLNFRATRSLALLVQRGRRSHYFARCDFRVKSYTDSRNLRPGFVEWRSIGYITLVSAPPAVWGLNERHGARFLALWLEGPNQNAPTAHHELKDARPERK